MAANLKWTLLLMAAHIFQPSASFLHGSLFIQGNTQSSKTALKSVPDGQLASRRQVLFSAGLALGVMPLLPLKVSPAFAQIVNSTVAASDTGLAEKGKKLAIFGGALVAADVIAGLVFGRSMLGIVSGNEDPNNWKTRLADSILGKQTSTAGLIQACAQIKEALERGDTDTARRLFLDAQTRFPAPEEEDESEEALSEEAKEAAQAFKEFEKLRRKVLFADWKAEVGSRAPLRAPQDRARVREVKAARREEARALLSQENAEQDAKAKRGRAKEDGDQGYMLAEDLLREGRLDEARATLREAEANWAIAGMMRLAGRPFELAIEGLIAKIDAAAAGGSKV